MFNDSMQGVSALSFSYMTSIKDIIDQNTFTDVDNNAINFFNEKGDIYLPFAKSLWKSQISSGIMPSFDPLIRPDRINAIPFFEFRETYLSNEITTITYNKSLSLPNMLRQLAENEGVYGVVIESNQMNKQESKKFIFNPLHPLNTFLIAAGLVKLPDEGKLHIFEFNQYALGKLEDIRSSGQLKKELKHYKDEYSKLFSLAPHIIKDNIIMSQKSSINDSDITSLISDPFVETLTSVIKVTKREGSTTELDNVKSLVIPTQLAVDGGIITPYYGMLLVKSPTTSSATATSLTPMFSGNINLRLKHESSYEQVRNNTSTRNICVGSESVTSRKGWFTLSKVNISSMFFSDIVDSANVLAFVEVSKIISGEIWDGIIKEKEEELEEAI
jgi:hypothetical protein